MWEWGKEEDKSSQATRMLGPGLLLPLPRMLEKREVASLSPLPWQPCVQMLVGGQAR